MPTATIAQVIDILKYANYRSERRNDATLPSDWCLIWPKEEVEQMERKYQEEVGNGSSV